MNLNTTIEIYAGGPGSGCNGPNCGRPARKAGSYDKGAELKSFPVKNMHEMAKTLQAHDFQRGSYVGNPNSWTGAARLGSLSHWEKRGEEVASNKPGELKPAYQRFRMHTVDIGPAGWHHTSTFGSDYQDHGRGLGADTLDKHLEGYGL